MSPGREEVRGQARQEEQFEQREQPVQSPVREGAEPPSSSGDGVKGSLHLAGHVTKFCPP